MKFDGVTVIDLSLFLPGPMLTTMMADHGARVIKVETPGAGEPNRQIGQRRDGTTVYFANTHRGKESFAVNLKHADGRAALSALLAKADVVVEAFRPGVAHRLGVDYEAVRAIRPDVIYLSISAYGQDGPLAASPAHDLAVEAQSGLLSNNVDASGRPFNPGMPAGDMLASTLGLAGVAMALFRRTQTGAGDYLDFAMLDSILACMPNSMGAAFADGVAPTTAEERIWGGHALYRVYATADQRYLALGGSEIKFAANLLGALGRPELVELCHEPGRHQQPVVDFLTETFATRSLAGWLEFLAPLDVCYAPVNDLRAALDHPQVKHREMLLQDERGWEHLGTPLKFAAEPGRVQFDAPALGANTESILQELGYSTAAAQRLVADGAVGVPGAEA